MADPVSGRYLPVRQGVMAALQAWPALAGVARWVSDEASLGQTAASQTPAIGVVYAALAGEERSAWAGSGRDHTYLLEVRVVVRALAAGACEDLLFGYVEAVEDALRADPTLGGLVRFAGAGAVRRSRRGEGGAFLGEAVVEVSCEARVSGAI